MGRAVVVPRSANTIYRIFRPGEKPSGLGTVFALLLLLLLFFKICTKNSRLCRMFVYKVCSCSCIIGVWHQRIKMKKLFQKNLVGRYQQQNSNEQQVIWRDIVFNNICETACFLGWFRGRRRRRRRRREAPAHFGQNHQRKGRRESRSRSNKFAVLVAVFEEAQFSRCFLFSWSGLGLVAN